MVHSSLQKPIRWRSLDFTWERDNSLRKPWCSGEQPDMCMYIICNQKRTYFGYQHNRSCVGSFILCCNGVIYESDEPWIISRKLKSSVSLECSHFSVSVITKVFFKSIVKSVKCRFSQRTYISRIHNLAIEFSSCYQLNGHSSIDLYFIGYR